MDFDDRRFSAARLAADNPIIPKGTFVVEHDTGKAKLGKGTTAYNDLEYWEPNEWATRHIFRHKAENESVNNSDVFQADNDLVFPIGASEIWIVTYHVWASGSTTADLKWQITAPSGATVRSGAHLPAAAAVTISTVASGSTTGLTGTPLLHLYAATVANSTTPGTVAFEWAQSTATEADTFVHYGSFLRADRIS